MRRVQGPDGCRNRGITPDHMTSASSLAQHGAVALMFPGQGSQFPGMARQLVQESPRARKLFRRADEVLGYGLTAIIDAADESELNRTIHTQPAVFVQSVALLECLRERCTFDVMISAGHSLGEYSALVAAGVLDFEEALDVIRVRAQGMEEAQPPGTCCMAALVGVSRAEALELVEHVRGDDVLEAANFNAPDQIVLSGRLAAVERAVEAAKQFKRARAVKLPVSSAFHTPLMESARQSLAERLKTVEFREPLFPVVANATGGIYSFPAEAKQLMVDQVVSPVLWEECVRTMRDAGATVFVEVGPGKVLTGLLRRIDRTAEAVNVSDLAGVESFARERA